MFRVLLSRLSGLELLCCAGFLNKSVARRPPCPASVAEFHFGFERENILRGNIVRYPFKADDIQAADAAPAARRTNSSRVVASSRDGGAAGPAWATAGGPLTQTVTPGGSVRFNLSWGIANNSAVPASDCVMSASFWFGGVVSNLSSSYGSGCTITPGLLTCNIGTLTIGQWGHPIAFSVAVPATASAGPLPYFIGGRRSFANGPEMFGRIEVQQAVIPPPSVQGCMLVERETVRWRDGAGENGCPEDKPLLFLNGDGLYTGAEGQYPAFIGKGALGTLEVAPSGAACCEQGGGDLFINPKPGSPIPQGCQGTGERISNLGAYMLLYWIYYNPYSPTLNPCESGSACPLTRPACWLFACPLLRLRADSC